MPRLMLLGIFTLPISGCDAGLTAGGAPTNPPITILGHDMGRRDQHFALSRGRDPIPDATVTINGSVVPASATGSYTFQLGQALLPGEELVLRVEHGGEVVEGRATIMAMPTLTAPEPDQAVTWGAPLVVSWTAATNPDFWRLLLRYEVGSAAEAVHALLPGSSRNASVATISVPAGATNPSVQLLGYMTGTLIGPVDPRSTMRVRVAEATLTLLVHP